MTDLQLNKAEKAIKKETRKMKSVLEANWDALHGIIREEYKPYVQFYGIVADDRMREIFYRCF